MVDSTGRGGRREVLKALGVAGAMGAIGLGRARRADAADKLVVGVIYVGPRDDYGYNQAQAQAAAAMKPSFLVLLVWPATTPFRYWHSSM